MRISNVRIVGHHGQVEILADGADGATHALQLSEADFDTLAEFVKPKIPPAPPPTARQQAPGAAGMTPEQFDRLYAMFMAQFQRAQAAQAQAPRGEDGMPSAPTPKAAGSDKPGKPADKPSKE